MGKKCNIKRWFEDIKSLIYLAIFEIEYLKIYAHVLNWKYFSLLPQSANLKHSIIGLNFQPQNRQLPPE
jgi:hypothetical protein